MRSKGNVRGKTRMRSVRQLLQSGAFPVEGYDKMMEETTLMNERLIAGMKKSRPKKKNKILERFSL